MAIELGQPSGVEEVLKQLRASLVITTFAAQRMLLEVEQNPGNRRQIFERYLEEFRRKPMTDPWIYEPAIVDNYGVFDDFARLVVERHSYPGVQNIIAHMENPYMVGSFLADSTHGTMLYWPGFDEYEWVRDCSSWREFADRCVVIDDGLPRLRKGAPSSRLWLSYATMRTEYYNSTVNSDFDRYFPEWRSAALVLDAMLLNRGREITPDRLRKRGHYIRTTMEFMPEGEIKSTIRNILASNPDIASNKGVRD